MCTGAGLANRRAKRVMRRRTFLGLTGGLCLLPVLSGCGRGREPLRIASHVWPGYEPMFLARRMGWLDPERVELVETASASASMERLASGEIHGAALTLDEVLRVRSDLRSEGVDLCVTLIYNISAGADMVIAREAVPDLAELRGRAIGVEESALGAVMLHHLLAHAGLREDDVDVVSVTIDEQEAAWNEGAIDAVITYEPVASRLMQAGGHRLFDSRSLPETIFDVLAVRSDECRNHAGALRHLTSAHFRALAHIRNNPVDAGYNMAERLGVPGGDAMETFQGLVLPDYHANQRLLGGDDPRLLTAARENARVMEEAGIPVDTAIDEDLVRDRFLDKGGR